MGPGNLKIIFIKEKHNGMQNKIIEIFRVFCTTFYMHATIFRHAGMHTNLPNLNKLLCLEIFQPCSKQAYKFSQTFL